MTGEIRSLNTLRGLAALIVLVSHYSNATLWLDAMLGTYGGQIGVMLFFILSGFLMAYLYGGKALTGKALKRFSVARAARVVPLFYLVVLASYIATQLGYPEALFRIVNEKWLLAHLLFLNGWDILWTIPPEIQFYALFPLFWWLGNRSPTVLFTVLLALLAVMLLQGALAAPRFRLFGLPGQFWLLRAIPLFLFGVLLGRLYGVWQWPEARRSTLALLALPALLLLYPKVQASLFGVQAMPWEDAWIYPALALIFFLLVFVAPRGHIVLENGLGDFYGRISYSLYLTHVPILVAAKPWFVQAPSLGIVLYLVAATAVAWLSYRVIELPSRRFIRGLVKD